MPRAIRFRQKVDLEAQLGRCALVDRQARFVTLDAAASFEEDEWILVRGRDLYARGWVEMQDLKVELDAQGPLYATYRGAMLSLTPLELRVLLALVRGQGVPIRRDRLLSDCWNSARDDFPKVEAAISRLRKKIVQVSHLTIVMERGVGYRLAARDRAAEAPALSILILGSDGEVRRALVRHLKSSALAIAETTARAASALAKRRYSAVLVLGGCACKLDALPLEGARVLVIGADRTAERRARAAGAEVTTMPAHDPALLSRFMRALESASARGQRVR